MLCLFPLTSICVPKWDTWPNHLVDEDFPREIVQGGDLDQLVLTPFVPTHLAIHHDGVSKVRGRSLRGLVKLPRGSKDVFVDVFVSLIDKTSSEFLSSLAAIPFLNIQRYISHPHGSLVKERG